ncbi:MAG: ABC transporter permease [Propionibacteriaceae bacterium]|nr:ABC transporter permease [Propionibacteriaceae bacterium]
MIRSILRSRELSIFLAFTILVVVTCLVNPKFVFSIDGWRDLWVTPSIVLVLAVGQAFVIISKNVDLSVGSVMGLSAFVVGLMNAAWIGMPPLLTFLASISIGALLGLFNGTLVAIAKVPGMVISLGTMYAYRGFLVVLAGSRRINASELNPDLLALGVASVPVVRIPYITLIAVALLIVAAWYLRNTRSGREFYAIGSGPEAAELYGLKIRTRMLASFIISGACAGLAGALYAARYGTISSGAGTGFELQAIGAAVIGGVAIVGGSGTVIGAAAGALLLTTIGRSLPILGIQDFWQKAVLGALILSAIILDRVLANRTAKRLIAERLVETQRRQT